MKDTVTALPLDSQLMVLSHATRRRVLFELLDANPQTDSVIDAEAVAPDADERELLISMYHVHLPKLKSMGLIETGREPNLVRRGPAFDEIESLLHLLDSYQQEFAQPSYDE